MFCESQIILGHCWFNAGLSGIGQFTMGQSERGLLHAKRHRIRPFGKCSVITCCLGGGFLGGSGQRHWAETATIKQQKITKSKVKL